MGSASLLHQNQTMTDQRSMIEALRNRLSHATGKLIESARFPPAAIRRILWYSLEFRLRRE